MSGTGIDKRFRALRRLTNHWSRPAAPRSYYWYLTFEMSPQLQRLVKRCQDAIAFPYYDLIPEGGLHLTLDRIALEDDMTSSGLQEIQVVATRACAEMVPFEIAVGSLGGTSGAVGFSASPVEVIRHLRDTLRKATLSVHPKAPVKDAEFHPHVTIAYCNSSDVPAAGVIETVEKLNALPSVGLTVRECSLVLLERQQRAYAWQEIFRIPLAGS